MNINNFPTPIREKSLDFPCNYYYHDKTSHFFIVPFHYHPEQQFVRVLKGSINIIANANNLTLNEGDCALITSNTVHCCQPCTEDTVFDALTFNLRELFDLSSSHFNLVKMLVTHQVEVKGIFTKECDPEIVSLFTELFTLAQSTKFGDTLILVGKMLEIFGKAVKETDCKMLERDEANRLYRYLSKTNAIFRFIFDHYKTEITLTDMAACVELSEKYFCKFFKELTDYRPMEYLNKFRVDVAAISLTTTNNTINEVARDSGFKDPCYFTKLFKRFKGQSPREFRENHPNRIL